MTTDLNDVAQRVIGWADENEEVEVYVSREIETDVEVREGAVESFSRAEMLGAGVRVVKDGRQGFAYTATLEDGGLKEALLEARDNASFATHDEWIGLARPDGVKAKEIDLWDESILSFPSDDKIELALELERRVRSGDERIRSLRSSSYGDGAIEVALATTTGISTSYRRGGCYISALAIAGEGDDTQTGSGYSVERSPTQLDVDKASEDAIHRSTRLLGAVKPQSAHLTVVFDNRVTPVLLSVLSSALSGEAVLKGRSFFAEREGQSVAVPAFTLVDDPTNPDAYLASSHDAEGLACRKNTLIENGVLQGFLYDSYAGRRAGKASNGAALRGGFKGCPGAGARALALTPGDLDQQGIISAIGNGVLIQGVKGVHSGVNQVSGDFSVGAEGLLIENGQIASPIREFTIASTVQKMLQSVVFIGNDVEWLPGSAAGVSIAVSDMSLSGL